MKSLRRHRKSRDSARSCSPEVDLATTTALISVIRANVRALNRRSTQSLHELRVQMNHLGVALDRISVWTQGNPELAPRVSKLSIEASFAAQEVLVEACSAAEQWDDEARLQADLTAEAAGNAGRAASALRTAASQK